MCMRQIFSALINTIRIRFASITARIRYWTNGNLIKTRLLTRLQMWLMGLFNVKPRHKEDYYTVFGIMISKRLVHIIVICIGLVSLVYLWAVKPFRKADAAGSTIKTYAYNSVPLRFVNADVNITAKKGYIAYTGHVKGGYAQGNGILYNSDGTMVYNGQFSKNMYNGSGKQYYYSGSICYDGEFKDNLYQGTGNLYRENGSLKYSGQFDEGYMDGTGELYNSVGDKIYSGQFKRNELVYTQLLNKTSSQIGDMYTGSRKLYEYDGEYIISLDDISALYVSESSNTSIVDDNVSSNMVYVVSDTYVLGDTRINSISELKERLGEPQYEGNSYITFYDAAAIKWAADNEIDIPIDTKIEYTDEYDEYTSVTSYDTSAAVYIYVYEMDGINYTFVSVGHRDNFFMYIISL